MRLIVLLILVLPVLSQAQSANPQKVMSPEEAQKDGAVQVVETDDVLFETVHEAREEVDTAKIHMVVEEQPIFPGGYEAMKAFLDNNVSYPESAKKLGVKGTVYVTVIIGRDGRLSDIRTLRGIHPACDKEAVRVITAMPNWIPGKQNNQPVKVRFYLPVRFGIDN